MHCSHQSSLPIFRANELGIDHPFPLLQLQPSFENHFSSSVPRFGNLETAPDFSVDAHAYFDYGLGEDTNDSSFPFSDYLNLESNYSSTAVEVSSTPDSRQSRVSAVPSSPTSEKFSISQPLLCPAKSASPSSTEGIPGCATKYGITPFTSFECQVCHQTYGFESRYKSHVETHKAIICTFEGCTEVFKHSKDRVRHIDSRHRKTRWPCGSYGQALSRKDKLTAHMKTCTGVKRPQKRKRQDGDGMLN